MKQIEILPSVSIQLSEMMDRMSKTPAPLGSIDERSLFFAVDSELVKWLEAQGLYGSLEFRADHVEWPGGMLVVYLITYTSTLRMFTQICCF